MIFILLDGRIVTVLTPDERGQMCQNNKMQMLLKANCASDSEGIEHPPIPVDHGQILIPLNWKRKTRQQCCGAERGAATVLHFARSSAAFCFISSLPHDRPLTSPAAATALPLPLPHPPTPSPSAPVVCVTVDPCKEDRSNISPPVYEAFRWGLGDMMIGADGWTGALGLKSVTDSGGFDSPPPTLTPPTPTANTPLLSHHIN